LRNATPALLTTQSAEIGDDPGNHRFHFIEIGNVGLVGLGLAARLLDLGHPRCLPPMTIHKNTSGAV
jgi:hypothetical protein